MDYPTTATGDQLGIGFPTTIPDLLEQGPAFLTRAFRATGALAADNAVTAITASKEFVGGGMGRKLKFTVAYERDEPGLETELFAKFPRDFGDPLRDLFTPPMEPEVRFSLLSRAEGFPIPVPACYFADYDSAVPSGVLITERIRYGEGSIEVAHDKCMDYQLADPLAHYEALTRVMAKLAAYHKAGGFGAATDAQFPFDPADIAVGRIPFTPDQLTVILDKIRDFVAAAPQLFPDGLGDPAFIEKFIEEAPLVLAKEEAIRRFLNAQTDLIALCHWNMNVDNAWFWREADGTLRTGLLDWGSVGQMNLAQAFFGMTCAAEPAFLDAHRDHLIDLLVAEYAAAGGPRVDADSLRLQVKLSIAVLGVAWMLDAPTIIAREVPEVFEVADRYDPRLRDNFLARAQLQLLVTFLNEWRSSDIGGAVRAFGEAGFS